MKILRLSYLISFFSLIQKKILDRKEEGDLSHPMNLVIYMDEMAESNIVNMPMPADDASQEEKDRFANRYLDEVLPKYEVKWEIDSFHVKILNFYYLFSYGCLISLRVAKRRPSSSRSCAQSVPAVPVRARAKARARGARATRRRRWRGPRSARSLLRRRSSAKRRMPRKKNSKTVKILSIYLVLRILRNSC